MILKSIYFNLNRSEYANDYGYDLLMKSRKYCDFIERTALKPAKFNVANFNRIVISFQNHPKIFEINDFSTLTIFLKFDHIEYEKSIKENLDKYFIRKLDDALNRTVSQGIDLPIDNIQKATEAFKELNYLNKWVFKKKSWKNLKIDAILECELTLNDFTLVLKIFKEKVLVLNEPILRTDPDPVAYHYLFKDIEIKENLIIVTGKTSENLFERKLSEI